MSAVSTTPPGAVSRLRHPCISRRYATFVLGFCLGLLLLGIHPPGAEAQRARHTIVFKTRFDFETLHNGLGVFLVPFDTPGVVAYWTIVRAGSRNEVEPGRSGYAHLFEHLMFRGTKNHPRQRYNEVIGLMGADHNAFTDRDWTVYTSTLPASELERMIELQADRFQNLSYDEAAHVQECGAVLGEFNIGRSDPGTILYEKLYETAYTTHTYRHTEMGWEEDVRSMPDNYDYGQLFFQRHYRPDNCVIVVVGDFRKDRALNLILKYYQLWKPGAEVATPPPEPPQKSARRAEISWPGPTTPRIVIGFHVPAYNPMAPEAAAMDILNEMAFGSTSPFHRHWIEESMQARRVEAEVPQTVDPGLYSIEVVLKDPADLEEARRDILRTLAELAAGGSESSIAPIRDHIRNQLLSEFETAGSLAYRLGMMYNLSGDSRSIHQYFYHLDNVGLETIQKLASEYLIEENSTTVTLVSAEES